MLTSWIHGCYKQIVKYTIVSFLGKKQKETEAQETDPWKYLLSFLIYRHMMQLFIHFKWGNKHLKYLAVVPLHNLHVNISIILKEKEVRSANSAGPLLFFANLFNLETDIVIWYVPACCLIDSANLCYEFS